MLKNKLISISESSTSASSLLSYFSKSAMHVQNLGIKVGIIPLKESLFSSYVNQCSNLENHFKPFFSLLGYLEDDNYLEAYQDVRNSMQSIETCILIGESEACVKDLMKHTESIKTTHKVANIQKKAIQSSKYDIYNIGYTRHHTSLEILSLLDESHSMSLGSCKQNIHNIEPMLRDTRTACIDISLISNTSVGLTIFEMCSIARYLGYSNSLDTLYFYHPNLQSSSEAMEQISLLTWYFLEGRQHRQEDFPTNASNQKYIVFSNVLDTELEFAKSKLTGRWWLQHPGNTQNYIPISYGEYEDTVKNDIPLRILSQIS